MSVTEYVAYRKKHKSIITNQAVTKAIRLKHRTPGVIDIKMYGGTYILTVDTEELDKQLVVLKKRIKLHATK